MSINLGPSQIQVSLPLPLEVATVELPADSTVAVVPVAGSPGPQGAPGVSTGTSYTQTVPAGTWTIPVPSGLGRRPAVAVYLDLGNGWELVDPDVTATDTQVVIQFSIPRAGIAVLT